jgi:hypothetical protein
MLKVYSDRLVCGDWSIPFVEIDDAVLYTGQRWLMAVHVLAVKAHGKTYQFGLHGSPFWRGELPFEVRREPLRMGYSWFSIIVRIIAWLALGYLAWQRFA